MRLRKQVRCMQTIRKGETVGRDTNTPRRPASRSARPLLLLAPPPRHRRPKHERWKGCVQCCIWDGNEVLQNRGRSKDRAMLYSTRDGLWEQKDGASCCSTASINADRPFCCRILKIKTSKFTPMQDMETTNDQQFFSKLTNYDIPFNLRVTCHVDACY